MKKAIKLKYVGLHFRHFIKTMALKIAEIIEKPKV